MKRMQNLAAYRHLLGVLLSLTLNGISAVAPAQGQTVDRPAADVTTSSARHALIIGIGHYADSSVAPLPGVAHDRVSATQMAAAMHIPANNIRYLQDADATGDAIRQAIADLTTRVNDGDKVFIHYSGHGTRYLDPDSGGCVEALLAHDGGAKGTLSNREMADLLAGITRKTDKLFVMYDACHSGGVVDLAPISRKRSLSADSGGANTLRPKSASISDACARPANIRTRSLLSASQDNGGLPQDIIHVSASRANEISFDDEARGGLATQFMRDCMLGEAVDLDSSGGISMEEIRACAQAKLDKRMEGDSLFHAHHLVVNGNANFVPAWFGHANESVPALGPTAAPAIAPVASVEQALQLVMDQRDAKRVVEVRPSSHALKIGKDYLQFSVTSQRAGYVYVVSAATDNASVYVLFPNALDSNNRIEAGEPLSLPRPKWRIKAAGPQGKNHILVVVADSPKDLGRLQSTPVGPFMASLNDAQGRANLGALMTSVRSEAAGGCDQSEPKRTNSTCSEAFGAALFTVEEAP